MHHSAYSAPEFIYNQNYWGVLYMGKILQMGNLKKNRKLN